MGERRYDPNETGVLFMLGRADGGNRSGALGYWIRGAKASRRRRDWRLRHLRKLRRDLPRVHAMG